MCIDRKESESLELLDGLQWITAAEDGVASNKYISASLLQETACLDVDAAIDLNVSMSMALQYHCLETTYLVRH